MITDARDIPLDEFEQELLERLLRAHAEPGRQAALTRAPRVWRRLQGRVLAVAVVLLATAGGAVAAVSLLGSSPPVRLPGGTDLCPSNYAYVADVSTRLVYPPNYPGHQFPDHGDIRCFLSAQDARAGGYRFAPTPSGDTRIGAVYLGATPADVRRTCARAQRLIRAVVYCPSRLPTPWIHPAINWDCPTADCFAPLLSLTGSFNVPASYVGSAPGVGEVTIAEASAGQQRGFPYLFGCLGRSTRLVSRTLFRGHPAAWYQCALWGGSLSSMLEWHFGKETYAITADGAPALRRRLVLYIAEHVVAQRSVPNHR